MTLHSTLCIGAGVFIGAFIYGIGIKVYQQRKELDFAKVAAIAVIGILLLGFAAYIVKGA